MREGADESGAGSHRDAVGWAEGYAGGEPLQGVADGDGVVERAERVDADVEGRVFEFRADVVGKTAPDDQYPVVISHINPASDFLHRGLQLDHTLELRK